MSRGSWRAPRRPADPRGGARALLAGLILLGAATAIEAAARYDPALRFRTIATPHFLIHFHQGEEALARRLADLAEEVHRELTARMDRRPPGRTHVILVDQHDRPGGWATPVPYNVIEISASGPAAASLIGHTTDWLRLVFTHEYVHVLHLDRSRGWAAAARTLFGRVPFALPNLTLPIWHIEGLATYEESRSGEGRLHAADFDAIVREAARTGVFEPIDRASGGLVDWPGGHTPYAYGARFHAHLAERYGPDRLAALARRTAGRVPYFGAGAFRTVFGKPLTELWAEFRDAERERARTFDTGPIEAVRLTRTGHVASGPRFDGRGHIVYSRSDPHGWPVIERIPSSGGPPERLATRIGGEQLAVTGAAVYFDQLEFERSVALKSDLYRLDRRTGEITRLTRGARLIDPDVSPEGRLAAVILEGPRRDVLVGSDRGQTGVRPGSDQGQTVLRPPPESDEFFTPIAQNLLTRDQPDAYFGRPRWSPDGRRLAVESRIAGIANIVLMEVDSGVQTVVAPAPGRSITPAWAPDGRSVLFASDRSGDGFAVYRAWLGADGVSTERLERLTTLPGGAHSPDVSPDGRSLVFVGYTTEGFDLFTQPLAPDGHTGAGEPPRPPAAGPEPDGRPETSAADAAPYQPWRSLAPRAWLPLVARDDHEWTVGAATGGADALAYHAWSLAAAWPVARDERFASLPGGSRPDVAAAYVYDRWRPALYARVEDDTTPLLADRGTAFERPFAIRDRSVTAGVILPFRRVRRAQTLTAAWRLEERTVDAIDGRARQTRGAARFGWGVTTATRFGYSISPEGGLASGLSLEVSRRALGSDFDATFARADVRAYVPVVPRHGVLALRATAAAANGDPEGRRAVRLGGASGDPGTLSLDEDASSLLRGFPSDAFLGDRVALVNAEYRVPLAWPQRGFRDWPVFLRALHGTVFADAGHAWSGDAFHRGDVKWSWGAEVSGDVTIGYWLPLTATVGIGWGRDGAGQLPDNRQVYIRLGHGF